MDFANTDKNLTLADVDAIVAEIGHETGKVIPILQAIQKKYHYLPQAALRRVCEISDITPAAISGVSTFYSQFRHRPVGKHFIKVCVGTACYVKGAQLVHDNIRSELKIKPGEDTDRDRLFTVETVACLGCCTLAPVVQIDDITYGHVKSDGVDRCLNDFLLRESRNGRPKKFSARAKKQKVNGEIRIGLGSCCVASGSEAVRQALYASLAKNGIQIEVKRVGCVGMCHQTPLMELNLADQPSTHYARVQPDDVEQIIQCHFQPRSWFERLHQRAARSLENIVFDGIDKPETRYPLNVRDKPVAAFLGRQKHIATEHCGVLDPLDMEEYRRFDGFKAVEKCLRELTPEQIIAEIQQSGLRGRGGAGFPTGQKWAIVRGSKGEQKYVICNGDEGDPGAFMDRMILESYPFRVIEGMMIAAYAVAAHEGYFYIRAEYPLAVRRIREAIAKCEAAGLLGENIFGTGFSLTLKITEGAGAFVCGEETALIESIEGKRGMPHIRPPYPAHEGLWGKPTLVNNVETYAVVPWILRNGAPKFAELGTEKSKGTKVFALAGKITRGGLIEVPMGITIREIVEVIGGMPPGRRFKAVQIGGPSGGCIPAELADTAIDFEALLEVGAMMGSGGLLVLDNTDCMVDIARYFLRFTQNQSCGKCTFCRIGTRRMLDILERICAGQGKASDLEELENLAGEVKQGSVCGLGKTAPNPILTTLKYFRHEYESHIQGKCPAGKCRDMIAYSINDNCIGCTKCAQVCPAEAIAFRPYEKHEIDLAACTKCDSCRIVCPEDAVEVN